MLRAVGDQSRMVAEPEPVRVLDQSVFICVPSDLYQAMPSPRKLP